jgi:hypothetical protein
MAVALTNLGLVAQARKQFGAARGYHLRSLELAETAGELRSVAESLAEIAQVDAAEGSPERAVTLFGAAAALRAGIGAPVPGPERDRLQAAWTRPGSRWAARRSRRPGPAARPWKPRRPSRWPGRPTRPRPHQFRRARPRHAQPGRRRAAKNGPPRLAGPPPCPDPARAAATPCNPDHRNDPAAHPPHTPPKSGPADSLR